jgi:hypothetical protein
VTLWRVLRDPSADVRLAAVEGLGRALADGPPAALVARLRDEVDGDARFAAALALALRASREGGDQARRALDEAAMRGAPTVRLTARIARAFIGRPAALGRFVRMVRTGF